MLAKYKAESDVVSYRGATCFYSTSVSLINSFSKDNRLTIHILLYCPNAANAYYK